MSLRAVACHVAFLATYIALTRKSNRPLRTSIVGGSILMETAVAQRRLLLRSGWRRRATWNTLETMSVCIAQLWQGCAALWSFVAAMGTFIALSNLRSCVYRLWVMHSDPLSDIRLQTVNIMVKSFLRQDICASEECLSKGKGVS